MMVLTRFLDHLDYLATTLSIRPAAGWDAVMRQQHRNLYAGRLARNLPQYKTHFGITPYHASSRNVRHDLRDPIPIEDGSIDLFQAEDVFEHIELSAIPEIFVEIYRILKPSGLFRFSVPDYRNSLYLSRSILADNTTPIFDPGGGGAFEAGRVVAGGHVWFPTIELVRELFDGSPFSKYPERIQYLHYNSDEGSVRKRIDYNLGYIERTPDNDKRSSDQALSIVVDAYK